MIWRLAAINRARAKVSGAGRPAPVPGPLSGSGEGDSVGNCIDGLFVWIRGPAFENDEQAGRHADELRVRPTYGALMDAKLVGAGRMEHPRGAAAYLQGNRADTGGHIDAP